MAQRPRVIAFDVIETLFSLTPLRSRLRAIGLKPEDLELWFAKILRDGFALAAADTYKPFKQVASAALEVLLADEGQPTDTAKIESVLEGFTELSAEPDVEPAFARLKSNGVRMITLTNGSSETTQTLLSKIGLQSYIEQTISIDEVKAWKPRHEIYQYAASQVGVTPVELGLVAAHAWDIHGAKRAGLVTGWIKRQEKRFQAAMEPPDVSGDTLIQVCEALLALPDR